mmetsp:Transcript_2980/g.2593  ORF Transcript_2980/g.2593 Transcript_2980/m.2593 type:complete len:103 (-) Transcript_2980:134-442(-)
MLLQLGGLSLKKSQIFYESNASTRWAAATRRRGSATQRCVAATTKRVAASQMCKMFIDNKKPCPLPLKVLQCVAVCCRVLQCVAVCRVLSARLFARKSPALS